MNPHIESTFPTEPDLYCAPGVDCESRPDVHYLVLTADELLTILQDHARRSLPLAYGIQSAIKETSAKAWADHIGPQVNKPGTVPAGLLAADARLLATTARAVYTGTPPLNVIFSNRDLPVLKRIIQSLGGFTTQIWLQTDRRGVQWINLMGRAGWRTVLNNTRYLAHNPRILRLGLGTQGLTHAARGSFVTAVLVCTSVEVVNWYFSDTATVADLMGGVGVELFKTGIALGLGYGLTYGAMALAVGATFIAIAPLVRHGNHIVCSGVEAERA
ncbi:MAG: hypothetical protein CTY21_12265 [Methylomonas sp.]|nr:MAG: hypothetical protein CTY21_12265 [Methylomonas sp.]